MASRDLQLASNSPNIFESRQSPVGGAPVDNAPETSLVVETIRRRWWLLGLLVLLSAPIAYFTATQMGKQSAMCRGRLMYTGLPLPPGPAVYQPPTLATYREILFSTPNMQRICDQHGLGMPPTKLAQLFQCNLKQGSSIMEISLQWADADDGISIVNDTMQLLVDEAARQRKEILSEYMKHVETAQLTAKNDVDHAAEQLRLARRKRDERLSQGGVTSDKYASALERVTNAQAMLDELHLKKLGIEQQSTRVQGKAVSIVEALCKMHLDVRKSILRQLAKPYGKGTEKWRELSAIYTELEALSKAKRPTPAAYTRWKSKLTDIGRTVLPAAETFETNDFRQLEDQLYIQLDSMEKLELELIPIANQAAMQEKLLADYETKANEFATDITGLGSTDFEDFEKKVEVAERRADLLKQQLENMQQLQECRTQEFSISMPAGPETTEVDSNKKKLFVLCFVATAALFCAPVFGTQWVTQRASPVARFANRWGLPVIAERLLKNYGVTGEESIDWRSDEAVRMTTLRIQQCLSHPGCVVLFSGLGRMPAPVKLLSSIAACLAHREERVLIVDAIDPSHVVSLATNGSTDRTPNLKRVVANGKAIDNTPVVQPRTAGLSEFLSRECEGAVDLIQPTACPGVDLISSGTGAFPHEAMASSCMTELFDHCRKTYSIILVAGPPVTARADFQMIAARADAILLAATGAAVRDPASREAVQDLIDLRAPVIGLVA